jgi:hypothetical protein
LSLNRDVPSELDKWEYGLEPIDLYLSLSSDKEGLIIKDMQLYNDYGNYNGLNKLFGKIKFPGDVSEKSSLHKDFKVTLVNGSYSSARRMTYTDEEGYPVLTGWFRGMLH